jgi:hypothetical protein
MSDSTVSLKPLYSETLVSRTTDLPDSPRKAFSLLPDRADFRLEILKIPSEVLSVAVRFRLS